LKGPPSVWITINLSDLHDPIVQVLSGEKVDLDNFLSTLGPDKNKRARNVAENPYAAAKFFHFVISTILETLFQIKTTNFKINNGKGIMGFVTAYFGIIECQGRGTLHLHMLIWLKHTPMFEELVKLLKSEEFWEKILAFIHANFRAYVPGLEFAESIKAIVKDSNLTYSRPPNPTHNDYDEHLSDFELCLAHTEQLHTCKLRKCLIQDKIGTYF
jgi:hypothetical protein